MRKERQYDEKFHILQAPTLFLPDLDYYRKKCGMRNLPLVVAYMDIDNFKDFNTKHGESYIDLYLLPRFMAALEIAMTREVLNRPCGCAAHGEM